MALGLGSLGGAYKSSPFASGVKAISNSLGYLSRGGESKPAPYTTQNPAGYTQAVESAQSRLSDILIGQSLGQTQQAFDYFGGMYGFDPNTGSTAMGRDATDRINTQIGLTGAQTGKEKGYLQGNYDSDLARLGLNREGLALDQAEASRRLAGGGYFDTLEGYIGRGLDIQNRGFDIDESEANRKAKRADWLQRSDATQRGAYTSEGNRLALSDIEQGLGAQLGQIGLGRENASLGADRERTNLAESKAQEQARKATLDLRSREYDLDEGDLQRNLNIGLERLNLKQWMDVDALIDKLNSTNLQDRMTAEEIYRNALEYSDLFPGNPPTTRSAPRNQAGATGYRR